MKNLSRRASQLLSTPCLLGITFTSSIRIWSSSRIHLCIYRGRLIFTPAQNHQIVEKTRFFDVISTNMIPYGFLLGLGTVPIRNRAVNDERNHRVSYLPKYRQKRWIFNEFRLKNWLHRTRADTESQVLRWWSKQYKNRWKTSKNDFHYHFSNFGLIFCVENRFFSHVFADFGHFWSF